MVILYKNISIKVYDNKFRIFKFIDKVIEKDLRQDLIIELKEINNILEIYSKYKLSPHLEQQYKYIWIELKGLNIKLILSN